MQIRYSLSGGVSTFSPHLGEIAIKFSLRLFRQIKTFLLRHFMQKPRISKSNFSKIHNKYFYQFQVLCADPIISLRKIHIRSIIQILLHKVLCSFYIAYIFNKYSKNCFYNQFFVGSYRRQKILVRRRLKCLCY